MTPVTETEALAFLSGLSASTIRLGLDRIEVALDVLVHPERSFRSVHVAGTNGKGSTCAFLASILQRQGYRVGLYTSPHLIRINERIKVDGLSIEDPVLGRRILEVLERLPEMLGPAPPLSFFEFGTLVAFAHFAREGVDVAVLETGLGGRLDATNVVRPLVSGVTAISLDHQEHLGGSLAEIAGEKAGIFKSGVPALSSRQPAEAARVLAEVARRVGAPFQVEGTDFQLAAKPGEEVLGFEGRRWALSGLRLGLRGAHQVHNAALALGMLEASGLEISEQSVREGLQAARWPGRLEEIARAPPVLLDAAHNPGGVAALVASLDALYPQRELHLVFGVLADKDVGQMVGPLFARCRSAHLAPPDSPRALPPASYLQRARELCPQVEEYRSVEEAFGGASAAAGETGLVLGAGSLVLIGQLERLLQR